MHLTCGLYNTEVRRSHWIHPPVHSSYTCAYPWGCCELKPLPSRHRPAGRIGNRHSLWTSLSQINGPHLMKIIVNLTVNAISSISHHHLCLKIDNPVDKRGCTVAQTFELARLSEAQPSRDSMFQLQWCFSYCATKCVQMQVEAFITHFNILPQIQRRVVGSQ